MKEVVSAPRASVLVESMRDIGYSLETAIADIVDNSISANAVNISICAELLPSGLSVAIIDDGSGMSPAKLRDAMRLGSKSPLAKRSRDDLGRFGLGLKTSSFSQCRKLTVVTRQNGSTCGAIWDLDHVVKTDDWTLQLLEDVSEVHKIGELGQNGTLVLWEKVDRIVGTLDGTSAEDALARRMSSARDHLSLVFHRFLRGEGPHRAIEIKVNERRLEPIDPFYSNHRLTTRLPSTPEVFEYNRKRVLIQGFTLPHYSKISRAEWERNEGPDGYLKSQGFYVYREQRLVIWGTWFGLIKASELTKLARVRVDITSDQDSDWNIDIKKASAQPPPQVRRRLRELVYRLTDISRARNTRSPRKLISEVPVSLWDRTLQDDQFRYVINGDHPLVRQFQSSLAPDQAELWKRIATLISCSLPVTMILGDMSRSPKDSAQTEMDAEELRKATELMVRTLSAIGQNVNEISANLQLGEPFRSNWAQTKRFIAQYFEGNS